MEKYYIKSIIGAIADGVDALVDEQVFSTGKKILLYGLDRNSFSMRTILEHRGYPVAGYVSDEEALVIEKKREIKDFSCRYLNRKEELIDVDTIQERLVPLDEDVVILIASAEYAGVKQSLEALGYRESVHFFKVYDFKDEELDHLFQGKRRMTLKEMQQTEKEILRYVDDLCRRKHLRYWVCGGTLLGTIRHKGFIPWDDDIDIVMPWQDYFQFIENFPQNDRYSVIGMGTSESNDFVEMFAKIGDKTTIADENVGTVRKVSPLWVDVFPLIGLPNDAKERHLLYTEYRELQKKIWEDFYAQDGDMSVFSKWFPRQKEMMQGYEFDKAEYVGVLEAAYGERDSTSREVYEETLRLPFEDIEVNAAAGYQEYLDHLYGTDWMQLPEESKRTSNHMLQAYWM